MRIPFAILLSVVALTSSTRAEQVTFDTTKDFFTSSWALISGPDVVLDAGRDHLGVTTPNPYMFASAPNYSAEENTYFLFDNFDAGQIAGSVTSAVLSVQTTVRTGLPEFTNPSPTLPFQVSAHRVTGDPTSISPQSLSSAVAFKNTEIGAIQDTVSVTSYDIYTWDVTSLVNEWIANGDANFDYSIAMSGRLDAGLDATFDSWFLGFVNSGFPGQAAQLVVEFTPTPEPTTATLTLVGGFALASLRRRCKRDS